MDMKLQPFDFAQAAQRAGMAHIAEQVRKTAAAAGDNKVEPSGFQDMFSQALQSVSQAQNNATEMQRQVQLDNPNVSLESTMVAMEKAQIGFQSVVQFRNRLVQAYTDIMNMQV